MNHEPNTESKLSVPTLGRRKFLRAGAAGAAIMGLPKVSAQAAGPASGVVNIALVGAGAQGEALTRALVASSAKYKWIAVCDMLEHRAKSLVAKSGVAGIQTYTLVEDMLAKHPELDAVFIAVPDFLHHVYTRICHEAGKHVYCEKMMSNNLDHAADMVKSQRESGKLLQIGHQRRSNPRYRFARNEIMNKLKVCGKITHAYAQWNRGVTMPNNNKFDAAQTAVITNTKFPHTDAQYSNTFEYDNWRWFKKYGGGALSDLGAHQIDMFNWMFGVTPRAVVASGGADNFVNRVFHKDKSTPLPPVTFEYPDNVICVYEYDVPGNGLVRAVYQVVTTNSSMQSYEKYMGEFGTMVIGEVDTYNQVYRERWDTAFSENSGKKWEENFFKKGYLKKSASAVHHRFWEQPRPWASESKWLDKEGVVDVRASTPLDPYELPMKLNKPYHAPHVENFLDVVLRGGSQTELNCPVEDAYKCAVAVLKVNQLVMNGGGRLEFKPEDFVVA